MNKVIFITGATKNTGLAIAEKFAKNGYDVALTSRRANDAEKTAAEIEKIFAYNADNDTDRGQHSGKRD